MRLAVSSSDYSYTQRSGCTRVPLSGYPITSRGLEVDWGILTMDTVDTVEIRAVIPSKMTKTDSKIRFRAKLSRPAATAKVGS